MGRKYFSASLCDVIAYGLRMFEAETKKQASKGLLFWGAVCLLCVCSSFQFAHADCLCLAAFCKSVFTLDGKSGILRFAGKFMAGWHKR